MVEGRLTLKAMAIRYAEHSQANLRMADQMVVEQMEVAVRMD